MRIRGALFALSFLVVVTVAARADMPEIEGFRQSPGPISTNVANLKDQLEKGLRVRLPAEFAFIAKVVTLVETDKLPLKLVKSTFQWARRKRPYPFPYFERAMKIRAAKIGVKI